MAGRPAGQTSLVDVNHILPINQIHLQEMNLKQLYNQVTHNTDVCLEWMAVNGLLKNQSTCNRCPGQPLRTLIKSSNISEHDMLMWRCKFCKSKKSIRADSFFENTNIPLSSCLDLIYWWCLDATQATMQREVALTSDHTSVSHV